MAIVLRDSGTVSVSDMAEHATARQKRHSAKANTVGGGSGTKNYEALSNKQQIEGVELSGNKGLDEFGIEFASYQDVYNLFD